MVERLASHLPGLEVKRIISEQAQTAVLHAAGQHAMAQGESGGQPHVSRALGIDFRYGQEFQTELCGERVEKGFFVGD